MLTRERLMEVLPELAQVENPQWREACAAIWQEAADASGWEDILDAPNAPDLPGDSLVSHTRSVLKGAFALADIVEAGRGIPVDRDKLRVICLLHDVCKAVELEPGEQGPRKSRLGQNFPHGFFSGYYCMKYGLPEDITAAVVAHSQFVKNTPSSIEGVLQFYADLADADAGRWAHGLPLLIQYCKI